MNDQYNELSGVAEDELERLTWEVEQLACQLPLGLRIEVLSRLILEAEELADAEVYAN